MLNGWFSSLRKENSKKREVNMKAKLCLKNLFIVSTLILIAFAASSCTVNADPPVYYTITAAEEIENGTVSVDKTSATSGETVKITATAADTYELSALNVTDENGNKIPVTDGSFTMPEGNVVVSATFASIFHNICIAQDIENGTVSVDKESAAQGETITVTAEPDEGYLLNSIHVTDADGNEITVTENTFTMPKAHVTVSATFGYEIKIAETIENGSVSTVKNSAMAGESVQIETLPLEGYELSSLTVTDAEGNEIAVTEKTFTMPESAVSICATFSLINYRLSIADGIQHGSVSLDKTTATMGETISITISSATGYQLVRLSADSSSGAAVEITDNTFVMPAADVNVSAEFSAIQYAVNIAGGISHGSVSADTATAIIGQSVTIMTKPDAGYKLTSLSVTDEKGKPIATSGNTFTMPNGSVTISAEFIAIIYSVNTSFNSDRGSISLDKTSAIIGEIVSISTTPAKDYVLYDISVTDSEGNAVAVTENSFTMLASSVTVSATFSFAVLKTGPEINSILSNLGLSTNAQFLPSENPPTTDETAYLISTDESEIPAYVWENGFTVYYYAKGYTDSNQLIPLNPNASQLFKNCEKFKTIDLSGFDTSKVTNLSSMFSGCSGLTSLDLSGLDTSSVTDMGSMFSGCSGLTSLDLSGLDTSSVTDMGSMFSGCYGLWSLDLSGLDTSSVTKMSHMFSGSRLWSPDLSGLDTSSVTDMSYMFSGSRISSLDLSGLDTSSVTDMSYMFYKSGLTSLDLSGLDTSNVRDMGWMFHDCSGLTSLDLSGLDTSNVRDMSSMFYGCYGLTSLDLSGLDTSSVTDMSSMFKSCSKLTTIYVSSAFNTNYVTGIYSSTYMFYGCTSLKGGKGTAYDSHKISKTYARIDGGTSDPGYFTEKK